MDFLKEIFDHHRSTKAWTHRLAHDTVIGKGMRLTKGTALRYDSGYYTVHAGRFAGTKVNLERDQVYKD